MTGKEYVERINRGYHGFDENSGNGFSYLHYLEVEMIDKLSALENEILEVFARVEQENGSNLSRQKSELKDVLDSYYRKLKDTEKEFSSRVDHIIWDRVGGTEFDLKGLDKEEK